MRQLKVGVPNIDDKWTDDSHNDVGLLLDARLHLAYMDTAILRFTRRFDLTVDSCRFRRRKTKSKSEISLQLT